MRALFSACLTLSVIGFVCGCGESIPTVPVKAPPSADEQKAIDDAARASAKDAAMNASKKKK